jgi:hypothetical protein
MEKTTSSTFLKLVTRLSRTNIVNYEYLEKMEFFGIGIETSLNIILIFCQNNGK